MEEIGDDVKPWTLEPRVTKVDFRGLMGTNKRVSEIVKGMHQGVEELSLSYISISSDELKELARVKLPRLKAILVNDCKVSSASLVSYLKQVTLWCWLTVLDLGGLQLKLLELQEIAKHTPEVEKLSVRRTNWTFDAARGAFENSWHRLQTLDARDCTVDLANHAHKFEAITSGRLKWLDLRGAKKVWNAEKLIEQLRPPMTHLLLGEVSGSLKGLKKKLPLYWLDLSGTDLTSNDLQQIFESKSLLGLNLNGCKGLNKTFYEQLPQLRELMALSLRGTTIESQHLSELSWKTIQELNLSDCPYLKEGYLSALAMPKIKILKLNGLQCVNDSVLASIHVPKKMQRIELARTPATLEGIAEFLWRCKVERLAMPSSTHFEIEDGKDWEEESFLRLLPHLPPTIETVSLCNLKSLSAKVWDQFVLRIPETVTSLTIRNCSHFYSVHLENVLKKVPCLKTISLCNLNINKQWAMNQLLGFKQIETRTLYLPTNLNLNSNNQEEAKEVKKTPREQMEESAYKGDPNAQLELGQLDCGGGELDSGIKWLDRAVNNGGGEEALYWSAFYRLVKNSKDEAAIENLQLAYNLGSGKARNLLLSLENNDNNHKSRSKKAFSNLKEKMFKKKK